MGRLPLFTSTLLFSWTALNTALKITKVDLLISPSADVTRGTDVNLTCRAEVLTFGTVELNRVYTIYKDQRIIYNKTTSSTEDFKYSIPEARVFNNGKYKCQINIMGEKKASEAATLTVTGMSKPVLELDRTNITEGEEIKASCSAPGETGSFFFNYYFGSEEFTVESTTSSSQVNISPKGVGDHIFYCSYSVFLMQNILTSEQSDTVTVTVKELSLEPVLEISPQDDVYEGDSLNITCSVSDSVEGYESAELLLSHGTQIIKTGKTSIHVTRTAEGPKLTIHCRLYVRDVVKVINKTVSVNELFSAPTLKMSAPEVFQGERISLICKSERLSSDKLAGEPVIYSLEPNHFHKNQAGHGVVFSGYANTINSNYTCRAAAKGINKTSNVLVVRPKVPVSVPRIWVSGYPVLGKKFEIFCHAEYGTPPITYTLWKNNEPRETATVQAFRTPANFTISISEPAEINEYRCRASNGQNRAQLSDKLQTPVIEPMSEAHLMVLPITGDISEGNSVTLICSFIGTPPVTVRWFRVTNRVPLETTTTNINNTNYPFTLSKQHSGEYYCEAENSANSVKSNRVELIVGIAKWKKLLISGTVILVVSSLVVGLVLFIRSRRGERETAAELSVKPASPKSDDSLTVTLTHDTEVYNAATDAASFYDDKEGRVTNGTRGSVASFPADISNRSSYSIPATV